MELTNFIVGNPRVGLLDQTVALLAVEDVRIGWAGNLLVFRLVKVVLLGLGDNQLGDIVVVEEGEPEWLATHNVNDDTVAIDKMLGVSQEVAVVASAIAAKHGLLGSVLPKTVSKSESQEQGDTYMKAWAIINLPVWSRERKVSPGMLRTLVNGVM